MLSLIEQIRTGSLWDFPGGVHPAEHKKQSLKESLGYASLPSEIVLPLKQHIGKAGDLLVNVGDKVLKGQPLTRYTTSFMLPVHATTSGTITAIEPRTTAHPSGLTELCVIIQPDGEDQWCERTPIEDFKQSTPDELIEVIRQAGVSGMGGAGFPTAKKIQSGMARTEILIVNAAECEPYITADDILMQEFAQDILTGIEIVEHILKPKLTIIGIEDNKPKAIKALTEAAVNKDIVIRVIPTKYPSGGEKQLIKVLTNKEVPNGGIPADIGLLVQNVGSLFAIKEAVIDGNPLIERIVTLTGKTFKRPRNVVARIGTPVESLLNEFGYKADKKHPRLIMGGPMMGFTLPHSQVPITKVSNCILAPTRREIAPERDEMACIRCSQCAEACPASLLPQQLVWYSKSQDYEKLEELNLKDCIECGACAYVCPSEIPLVHYYRQSKAEMKAAKQEADAAERAKQRFEEKNARLERDKQERENRFKKAAESRRTEMKAKGGDDAVAAAIARVKAQKEATTSEPAVKPAVAAAIAKAKAKQAEAAKQGVTEPDNSDMAKLREERKRQARERKAQKAAEASTNESESSSGDAKKDAVAAAIARAKAKKAAQANSVTESTSENTNDSKSDAVAAAVARAKARKAAQASEVTAEDTPEATAQDDAPADPKKAAVAAAIARAKARKAAQDTTTEGAPEESSETESQEETPVDPKKAAVAAAIARAKARKAAQEQTTEASAEETSTSEAESQQEAPVDPKKAAVAAAIARAKARKAAQEQATEASAEETSTSEAESQQEAPVDPQKAAVAAAIARAKARKAAQEQATEASAEETSTSEAESQQEAPVDPKKAAVASAIARAKARKAAQEQATEISAEETSTSETEPQQDAPEVEAQDEAPVDPKKAAVAAAIARAKARKAAQEKLKSEEE
ncbi:electron transport complex subunit RsxC [Vibrio maerlii]|uniref:electron transport complex subunit RsxC n=1 Tax=Vibrio maerlii TaxID=2231648 RepID=UPI000E3C43D1|nr:electron transport complex subunit RsxC [Vibrio maerlii]